MNAAQIISFVLYVSLFTGLSIIIANIVNEHDCSKLTLEMYLESSVYKQTNTPYDQAVTACFEFQNALSILSTILPIIGFGLGSFFMHYYRTKEIKK